MMNHSLKNYCEKCGKPINHLTDFGTNQDGTINTEYCRHCYRRGEMVSHGMNLKEKILYRLTRSTKKKSKKLQVPA